MKKILFTLVSLLLGVSALWAAPVKGDTSIPAFPKTLTNARYVYVTSYDGDQFNPNLLPEDRQAISSVQDALQKSGKFIVVYRPREAEMVLMVQSRPSEDVLAVYDARGWPRNGIYLWRVMAANGLQPGETPLVTDFLKAFAKAAASK